MRLHRAVAWLGIVLLLCLGVSFAQTNKSQQNANLSSQDQQFVQLAAHTNLGEVALGNLAEQKASENDVKDFGRLMIKDHSAAEKQLKDWASSHGVTLPTQPGANAQRLKQDLSAKSGRQFDQAYIRDMMQGHDKVIMRFEQEIQNGQEPQLKAYAESVLPKIQDHIRIAENLSGRMGMSGKAGLSDQAKAITAVANKPPAK